MKVELNSGPGNTAARLILDPGEVCTAEGGSMIAMSGDMKIETTTHKKGKGGVLKAVKRMLAGENFFVNHYTAGSNGGEVFAAPTMFGDMIEYDLKGETLVVQAGSWLASEHSVNMDMGWQGLKTLFSGESLFWLHMSGQGKVVLNSFGAIYSVEIDGEYIVDTGHVVAFQETLDFSISKAGKSWISSILGGEGLVLKFKGKGTVWCQSHNPSSFGRALGPMLPPR